MMMMMVMMMMIMCKRLAQVPMLCVPIYNMKLAMVQKTPICITFSAHTKMAADKRRQIEVFARNHTYHTDHTYCHIKHIIPDRLTYHAIPTIHTVPHPHHTTGGEGDSTTPPPHHRGEGEQYRTPTTPQTGGRGVGTLDHKHTYINVY